MNYRKFKDEDIQKIAALKNSVFKQFNNSEYGWVEGSANEEIIIEGTLRRCSVSKRQLHNILPH